jgi:hypothetical protein
MLSQAQLLYQVTPIFLTGGIAGNITGGILPLLSLTNSSAFSPNLLSGSEDFELEDAFGIFQPAAGGSISEQVIAQYPFANLSVAANAIIRNPINISMIMFTPMKQVSSWAVKLATMSALKATLDQHNNSGGTYTVCTPAYIYTDMLMLGVIDVSTAASPLPQNAWRWDFTRPLVSLQDIQGAMNNLMSMITNGVAPPGGSSSTATNPATTNPATALTASPSGGNQGTGAGGTAPWVPSGADLFNFGQPNVPEGSPGVQEQGVVTSPFDFPSSSNPANWAGA